MFRRGMHWHSSTTGGRSAAFRRSRPDAASRTRSSARWRRSPMRPVRVVAAGRTDAGVHATSQIVHFDARGRAAADRVGARRQCASAGRRPPCCGAQPVHGRLPRALRGERAPLHVPAAESRPSGPACSTAASAGTTRRSMSRRCAKPAGHLVGTHDFSSFRAAHCQAKSPVKTLRSVDVAQRGAFVRFDFAANAFLHHMVRNIVGALSTSAAGKRPARLDRRTARGRRSHARRRRRSPPTGSTSAAPSTMRASRCRRRCATSRLHRVTARRFASARKADVIESAVSPKRTRIKICGITRVADALAAVRRRRRCDRPRVLAAARRASSTYAQAQRDRRRRCRRSCRSSGCSSIRSRRRCARRSRRCRSTLLQFHGAEPAGAVPRLRPPLPQGDSREGRRRFARIACRHTTTPRACCSTHIAKGTCRAAPAARSTGDG